jgi:hypothetical protein
MPGPVSDSFDPEFGTGANAGEVRAAIEGVVARITEQLGPSLRNIVEIAYEGPEGPEHPPAFSENELRVIRFGLNRALETL